MLMVSKTSQSQKDIEKKQKFIKDAKAQKYGKIEKTSITYARINIRVQPKVAPSNNIVFYGVR